MTVPYRPVRGYEVSFNGDAQAGDLDLQDANLTQQGIVLRGPGARERAFRTHETGGTEAPITGTPQALFFRPDVAGDELCMVAGDTLYTSKPTEITVNGTQAWKRIGDWAPWSLRQSILHQPLFFVTDLDVATIRDAATGNLYHVVVWSQPNVGALGKAAAPGIYAVAIAEDGGIVADPVLLDPTGTLPRACACDTGVVITWWDAAPNTWMGSAWTLAAPDGFQAVYSLASVAAGAHSGRHDMRKDGANDRVIMVYTDTVGTFVVSLTRVTVGGVVTSLSNTVATVAPTQGVSIDVDPLGGYLVTWASGTQVSTRHFDGAGAPTTAEVSFTPANPIVRVTGCHKDGVAAQGTVAVEQRVGASPDYRCFVQVLNFTGAVLSNLRSQRGAALWGHALIFRERPVAWVEHYAEDGIQQGVEFLTDLRTGTVLARAFLGNLPFSDSRLAQYVQPGTPHVLDEVLYQGSGTWTATIFSVINSVPDCIGVTRVEPDLGPRNAASVPGYAFDAHAGFPVQFNGREATEADWHVLPQIATIAAGAAGSLTPSATYVVAVTYKHVARNGDVWRSAPAASAVALGVGQNSITLTLVPCRWTERAEVQIEVWCSLANQGFPLYIDQQLVSNKALDGQVVTVISSDATHLSNGLTLDQFAPSSVLDHSRVGVTDHMTFALGRFWSPDPQRPDILRHTIEHDVSRDGFGWGWEDTQLQQIDTSVRPQAAGPIQGGMAIFAGNIVHLLNGLGPDKQGAGLFQAPLTTFGVVDLETSQAKIATIPDAAVPGGLVYATPRGLYLLQRDQLGSMLSRQVERQFRFDGVVPQAIAFAPIQGDVFMMTATDGARSLRFNVLTNRWCADSARRAQDVAVSPRGVVAWLLPDGRVRILDESLIADGDDDLVFRGTTPLFKLGDNVSQPVTVQGLLTHTYLLSGPAVVTFRLQDGRTGDFIPPLSSPPFTVSFAQLGPESVDLQPINMPTIGMRVIWEQPAGDTGKIAIVELDVQLEPSSSTAMVKTVRSM